jgi:hypothetical protein
MTEMTPKSSSFEESKCLEERGNIAHPRLSVFTERLWATTRFLWKAGSQKSLWVFVSNSVGNMF